MKIYFTPEEMHTPEYKKYIQWVADCWKLNDERNKQLESDKRATIKSIYPTVTEGMKENARKLAKELYQKQNNTFWAY